MACEHNDRVRWTVLARYPAASRMVGERIVARLRKLVVAQNAKASRAGSGRTSNRRDWEALGQAFQDFDRATEYSDVPAVVETAERWAELTVYQRGLALTCHHPSGRTGAGRVLRNVRPVLRMPASAGSSHNYQVQRDGFAEWLKRGGYSYRYGVLMRDGREVMIAAPERRETADRRWCARALSVWLQTTRRAVAALRKAR